jgi:hypothetical protein
MRTAYNWPWRTPQLRVRTSVCIAFVNVKDCDAALRDSKQRKFPEVPPEECFYPHEIPLKDSNRQSDMYGLENFVILDHPASFRRRTRSQDVRFEAKVRIMDGFLVFFRL